MKVIEVTEKEVKAAFDAAKTDEVKNVLAALFCKEEKENRVKPTLDDYKTIKSYEDACEALGIKPILTTDETEQETVVETGEQHFIAPKHLVALYKLETISRALWGRNWEPMPNADGSQVMWYPWLALWTKDEIKDLNEEQRGALLSAAAGLGASAGFGCLHTLYRSSYASAHFGFRLCQETDEKAAYFGRQFVELWADYLKFNFEVGWRM